jgi:hypothetical protein
MYWRGQSGSQMQSVDMGMDLFVKECRESRSLAIVKSE